MEIQGSTPLVISKPRLTEAYDSKTVLNATLAITENGAQVTFNVQEPGGYTQLWKYTRAGDAYNKEVSSTDAQKNATGGETTSFPINKLLAQHEIEKYLPALDPAEQDIVREALKITARDMGYRDIETLS